MKLQNFGLKSAKKAEIIGSLILLAVFILPVFLFAGGCKKIYVDDDASGKQDGSSKHPYKTIGAALKKADEDDEVHILPGYYRENIEIPKEVEVYGSDEDQVIIEAKDDDEPVVKMKHKTEINKVTVKKGKYGIEVGRNDRASIIECVIKDNDRDGIKIKEGEIQDKYKVSITESLIKDNGKSGIYSQKRRIILIDNEISDNNNDGVDLAAGSKAWIDGNRLKDNDGSGLKLVLDGSEIWTKNNTYYGNEREGAEINAYGGTGRIDFNKSKFYKNGRYGIARVQRGNFTLNVWQGVTIQADSLFWENGIGNVSEAIKIF